MPSRSWVRVSSNSSRPRRSTDTASAMVADPDGNTVCVNLAAPVVQLQVPFAMMLAVATLHEKFTILQVIGSVLMLGGSFVTQTNTGRSIEKRSATPIRTVAAQHEQDVPRPGFRPRVFQGYVFALGAAMCYGSSPLMARQA